MTSSKLLKIIFGVLIIIVAGELIYYYYIHSIQNIQNVPQTFYSSKKLINKIDSNQNITTGIASDYSDYLNSVASQRLHNPNYERYFLVYELKGKLIKIDWGGRESSNPSYVTFGIYIKTDETTKEHSVYFPDATLKKIKVYLVQNNIEKPTEINQLREGDNIVYQHFEDLSHKKSDKNRVVFHVIKIIR